MNINCQSMTFLFPTGATINRVIYPGAMLDPDHSNNDLVWLGSGLINSLEVHSPVGLSPDFSITVLDIQTFGAAPVRAANDGPLYAIEDGIATAQKVSLGDPGLGIPRGTLIYEVIGGNTGFPAEINVAQSRKARYFARHRNGTPGEEVGETFQFVQHPIPCHFGMGLFCTGPDVGGAAEQITLDVEFTQRVLGGTRYSRARLAQGSQYIV